MKAFFNRINRGLLKDKDKERDTVHREKHPSLPHLPEWPPRSTPTPTNAHKPLPELATRPLPPVDEPASSSSQSSSAHPTPNGSVVPLPAAHHALPAVSEAGVSTAPARVDNDSTGRSSHKTHSSSSGSATQGDIQKKVAFRSPPPTPGPGEYRPLSPAETPTPANPIPLKSTVSRFQAAQAKDGRGSTSTATSSKTDVASTMKSAKAASTRGAPSPYPRSLGDGASIHQSLRSATPYSMTNASSRILSAQSWSEGAEEDLVCNIGQRERTRQEVLWEIVASEERYVNELIKMKETFIEPLLHPYSSSSPTSPTGMAFDEDAVDSPRESIEHLPIAQRFLSPTPFRSDTPSTAVPHIKDDAPNIDGESLNSEEEDEADDRMGRGYSKSGKGFLGMGTKNSRHRSPYGATSTRTGGGKSGTSVPFPSRSHQSLPPPPRMNPMNGSTQSLGRQSMHEKDPNNPLTSPRPATTTPSTRVFRKFKKSNPSKPAPPVAFEGAVPPAHLPEDLRKCLEVIENGILDGHVKLSESLRKRYEEQYPLVRSLADVFVQNSHILHGYATFVLHLERALEQVDNALSTASAKKKPKNQDATEWLKVCQYLERLEMFAAEKGETGLAISLSKPFQRLLKYPLLFQNLLFHTDPSTFEYESTLQMVAEVETIVRSIEDEKIQKEERDKTRDVFARIEGLDKVKQLMVPKPSRVLVEERPVFGLNPIPEPASGSKSPPPTANNARGVKGKTSFKRLSDVLQAGSSGVGGKKDQWLVVFNDVVLRCQRTGTTSLPLVAATNSRATSMPELQGKAKYATTGRRNSQGKPRNLYKFLKIETWAIGELMQPKEGVVSMEEVARSRQQVHSGIQPRIVPMPDDDEDGSDSDDSDRKSKMSFSYWGADKVTLQKPNVRPRPSAGNGARRGVAATSYGRESSANAKFGTRLVAADHANGVRPSSRRANTTPTSRRPTQAQSDEGHSAVRATVTRDRPAWDTSTRAPLGASTAAGQKRERMRNISQGSTALTRTMTNNSAMNSSSTAATSKLPSPAPSEDSGVGMYRNLLAQNPSLGRIPT